MFHPARSTSQCRATRTSTPWMPRPGCFRWSLYRAQSHPWRQIQEPQVESAACITRDEDRKHTVYLVGHLPCQRTAACPFKTTRPRSSSGAIFNPGSEASGDFDISVQALLDSPSSDRLVPMLPLERQSSASEPERRSYVPCKICTPPRPPNRSTRPHHQRNWNRAARERYLSY